MDYQFAFERLDVWQLSKKLTIDIYKITKSFPAEERYGLVSQINRAAVSVPANIAEGSSRINSKDQSRFYSIAYSSLMELISHLYIANDLNYISIEILSKLKSQIYEISNKLNALYRYQKRKE